MVPPQGKLLALVAPLLLAGVSALALPQSPHPVLQFFQEEIAVEVMGDSAVLTGVYHFRNLSAQPARTRLLYPFPRRPGLPEPRRIEVLDVLANRGVGIEKGERCVQFPIAVKPWGESAYRVRYVQPTPAGLMEYLLTTGRAWGRPLEKASFSVYLPDRLKMTFLSYPRDTLWKSGGGTTYEFHRRQFWPDRELTVRWQRRSPP
jgi:hypothetical protein